MASLSIPAPTASRAGGASYGVGLAFLASIFFMWGFVTVLNDVLIPHLKSVFELDYRQTLLIQFVFFSTYFVMALPGAKLIEWVGYKYSIAIGLAIAGAGALLFVPAATLGSYPLFLGGLFVLAAGTTALQVAANPYVAVIGPADTASSRLNLVQAFNSLGTALAPGFGGMLLLSQSVGGTSANGAVLTHAQRMSDALVVRTPYAGIACVLFMLAALMAVWKLPALAAQVVPDDKVDDRVSRHPRLVLGIGAIFVYVGAEIGVGSFLINYISSPSVADITHAQSAFYVTCFWSGAMIGRFLGSLVMRYVAPALMLGVQACAAILLILTSINTGGTVALWAIVLVGLMNSIMFPTIFTLAIAGLGHLTQRGSGMLIMAIVGGAIMPMLQAVAADHFGVRPAFVIPALCYAYIVYFAWRCRA